jgi:hypothetical protein
MIFLDHHTGNKLNTSIWYGIGWLADIGIMDYAWM